MYNFFFISGYWEDTDEAFEDYLVTDSDEVFQDYVDEMIFQYGWKEHDIIKAMNSEGYPGEIAITSYRKAMEGDLPFYFKDLKTVQL